MKATVHYLYNSGFTLQTDHHFFIFDYYLNKPRGGKLTDGVIDPAQLKDLPAVVFASHAHYDHYTPEILQWRKQLPHIRYLLSDDIHTKEPVVFAHPGQHIDMGDFTVEVLKSNDEGAAFFIQADGLGIYHAGDLNWWHWNGESDAYNTDMARRYQEQIDLLKGRRVDVAFVPMDPRLEDKALLGLDYFMRTIGAAAAFPMHFSGDLSAWQSFQTDSRADAYRGRVHLLARRGESLTLDLPGDGKTAAVL